MSDIFFTSDQHFGHENIIKFCNRPFSSVSEMNTIIIEKYNSVIGPGDTVYHLGDFCFDQYPDSYFRRLNGNKVFIKGNHDRKPVFSLNWNGIHDIFNLNINKQNIVLCHYAMVVWNKSAHGGWHLYGHSHNTLKEPANFSFDVGVDSWDFYPVSLDQVAQKMEWKKTYRTLFSEINEKHSTENLKINKQFLKYGK